MFYRFSFYDLIRTTLFNSGPLAGRDVDILIFKVYSHSMSPKGTFFCCNKFAYITKQGQTERTQRLFGDISYIINEPTRLQTK